MHFRDAASSVVASIMHLRDAAVGVRVAFALTGRPGSA
jgi:hypothetical protein